DRHVERDQQEQADRQGEAEPGGAEAARTCEPPRTDRGSGRLGHRVSLNSCQRCSTSSAFSNHHWPSLNICTFLLAVVVGNSPIRSCGSSFSRSGLGPV